MITNDESRITKSECRRDKPISTHEMGQGTTKIAGRRVFDSAQRLKPGLRVQPRDE